MSIDTRLAELGIVLPAPPPRLRPMCRRSRANGLLHISGQLPFRADGSLITGRLGQDVTLEDGTEAAKRCGIMLIAQIKAALGGDLSRVERIVKLGAFISSTADFTDQPKVANGASELMQAVFGDAGRHARSAVGVPVLPLSAAVEVDAIVAVRPL
jgi:enamine deaminase RidA (YjgF/YER057c/UK114 family)